MGLIEITLIGVGLAMDAVAVSISNAMVFKPLRKIDYIAMILAFGIFQGIMPLLGYYAGSVFARWITRYSGIQSIQWKKSDRRDFVFSGGCDQHRRLCSRSGILCSQRGNFAGCMPHRSGYGSSGLWSYSGGKEIWKSL